MTIKERVIEQLEGLDEAELLEIEKDLNRMTQARTKRQLEEEFRLLDELAVPMSEEDKAVFEEATKRRPLFGNRKLTLEPDAK